jgi:hypothetical protein
MHITPKKISQHGCRSYENRNLPLLQVLSVVGPAEMSERRETERERERIFTISTGSKPYKAAAPT